MYVIIMMYQRHCAELNGNIEKYFLENFTKEVYLLLVAS